MNKVQKRGGGKMSPKDKRHQFILEQLDKNKKVMVTTLASLQNVTPETIRRDLEELALNEQLTRVHGGAIPFVPTHKEMVYEKKLSHHYEEKRLVAKKAASMIEDGDTIAVDVGTTTVHIADMIENVHSITVVTNSLRAADRFNLALEEKRMTGHVVMLPGVTHPEQASVKGIYTVEFLKRFSFDRAFISCGGLTIDSVYDFDMDESLVSEVMVNHAKEAILLTDGSKINKFALFEISPLNKMTKVICNKRKPSEWESSSYEWIHVEPDK